MCPGSAVSPSLCDGEGRPLPRHRQRGVRPQRIGAVRQPRTEQREHPHQLGHQPRPGQPGGQLRVPGGNGQIGLYPPCVPLNPNAYVPCFPKCSLVDVEMFSGVL